ncbi:MAG: hemerythrin [Sulfurimonas sp.]|jgi:hemerythrin|uniref:bacteriohemerythrin n=1 Tax=Sulfurimonas sp. TaxID=2022749 RepID=UPI0039E580F8
MSNNNKIPWDDNYKIGIKSIDDQHKTLFNLVNKLYDLDESTHMKDDLKSILYEFSDYMKIHFRDEEKYMLCISYPLLEEHEKLHLGIIDTLTNIIQTPASLNIIKSKMRIIAKRALVDHITQEDIKIKLYATKEGIEEVFEL